MSASEARDNDQVRSYLRSEASQTTYSHAYRIAEDELVVLGGEGKHENAENPSAEAPRSAMTALRAAGTYSTLPIAS